LEYFYELKIIEDSIISVIPELISVDGLFLFTTRFFWLWYGKWFSQGYLDIPGYCL
jgi:hypothetical protein